MVSEWQYTCIDMASGAHYDRSECKDSAGVCLHGPPNGGTCARNKHGDLGYARNPKDHTGNASVQSCRGTSWAHELEMDPK